MHMKLALKTLFISIFLMVNTNMALAQKAKAKNKQVSFKKHRIVMQLTSNDAAVPKGLVKQLYNLKRGWGDTVQIEVVCHGPGIDFLHVQRTAFREDIYQLKDRGIVFIACENTLKERSIDKEFILPQMEYVEMGIGHLVLKQEQGWSYIKAGF